MQFLSTRAKSRQKEHGEFQVIGRRGDRVLLRCVNPACRCGKDATGVRWLGWMTLDKDVSFLSVEPE